MPTRFARLIFVVIWCFASCATPPTESPEDPTQLPGESVAGVETFSDVQVPLLSEEALLALDDLLQRGQAYEALSRVRELEEINGGDPTVVAALAPFRLRARRLLRDTALDARVILDQERVSAGTPITGALTLSNPTGGEIQLKEVHQEAGRTARTAVLLTVQYTEHGTNGVLLSETSKQTVHIGRDLIIQPGETAVVPIILDSLEFGEGSLNYRVFSVEAVLYPALLTVLGSALPGTITFEGDRCQVFPRNYEHLLDDPAARVLEAIEKNSPTHLTLAAALVPASGRDAVVNELLRVLSSEARTQPSIRLGICVALRILTDTEIGPEPDQWLAWGATRTPNPR
ncbi:MAG TPA: hypothetical protein PKA37_04970 [Planctomycetota bacterium]|jgi:hypothetical protein|nr:hypothetical protein [Planctomycetota bacterium]